MEPFETYEHNGVRVEFHYQEFDQEIADPREGDQLTTFVCWHSDYVLGDFQVTNPDGRGAVDERFERDDFRDLNVLERYIGIALEGVCILPLYLLDHSGLSMRAGSPSPFDSGGWDTTMVGFVYTTHKRISELCGDDPKYHAPEWIEEQVRQDVRLYDKYLRGEVYGYIVAPGTSDEESCWGFLGDPDESGMREEANWAAAAIAEERARLRALPWLPTFGNPIRKAVAA